VKRTDAVSCEAVLTLLVQEEDGTLREDFGRPPKLVPLALLGGRVAVETLIEGDACTGTTFRLGELMDSHGGPLLTGMVLTESMFGAEAMEAEGGVAFEAMKVAQLKEELAARGSTRTGLKATLQRRLHSLLVQAALSGSEQ
jgi:hypothetical protein